MLGSENETWLGAEQWVEIRVCTVASVKSEAPRLVTWFEKQSTLSTGPFRKLFLEWDLVPCASRVL